MLKIGLTVDNGGLEIRPVASRKITFSPGCPEESDGALDHPVLQELILLLGLDGHQIHAVSSANVPPSYPVNLEVLGQIVLPGEKVVVPAVLRMLDPVRTVSWVGKAEGSRGLISILTLTEVEEHERKQKTKRES